MGSLILPTPGITAAHLWDVMLVESLERHLTAFNPLDYGAIGDGAHTAEDTAAWLDMAADHLSKRAPSGKSAGPVVLPPGYAFDLDQRVVFGDASPTYGFKVLGPGKLSSRITWHGATTAEQCIFQTRNCVRPVVGGFYAVAAAGTRPGALVWIAVDDGMGGPHPVTYDLEVSNGVDGLRIGGNDAHALAGTLHTALGEMNLGGHYNFFASDCDNSAHICGVNSENHTFYNLGWSSAIAGAVVVLADNVRGIGIHGVEGSFTAGSGQTWLCKERHYTQPGGMGLVITGPGRVERLSGLWYVDADGAGGNCATNQPFNVSISGIEPGSYPTGGPYFIADQRAPGTAHLDASCLGPPESTIEIGRNPGVSYPSQNTFNELILTGVGFDHTTADTDIRNLVKAYMRSGQGDAGGVRIETRGCLQLSSAVTVTQPVGRIRNRVTKMSASQINAGTKTETFYDA